MENYTPNFDLRGVSNGNAGNMQLPASMQRLSGVAQHKSYNADSGYKRVSDKDPELVQDAIANVHYWFNDFVQRNHEMVNKAYRILNSGADELKYAISLKTYSTDTVVALASFIQEFKRSSFSKFIRLDVDIVPQAWEADLHARQLN